jgi:hypothetical protein
VLVIFDFHSTVNIQGLNIVISETITYLELSTLFYVLKTRLGYLSLVIRGLWRSFYFVLDSEEQINLMVEKI